MMNVFVGFDQREAVAFHVFTQSLISKSSRPVSITPLALHSLHEYTETHSDGSNAFIYSRFLVPHLMGFKGWALFVDGDMLLRDDIAKLWALRDDAFAVQVVKHKYTTRHKRKYIGSSMETINPDYPRKNWSSVVLWNCGHPANRVLTPAHVMAASGSTLHRFEHLLDDDIGELPAGWNWLAGEYPMNDDAMLVHYTLGVPGIEHYANSQHADEWRASRDGMNDIQV